MDEALCFGWIDGVRKRVDDESYTIRFTPRRPGSTWSAVNIARAQVLVEQGRMRPAGRAAFEARQEKRSGTYSYEQRGVELPEPYAGILRKNEAAWRFHEAQAPSYRKAVSWWIVSAKQEETRRRRLERLVAEAAMGRRLSDASPAKTPR